MIAQYFAAGLCWNLDHGTWIGAIVPDPVSCCGAEAKRRQLRRPGKLQEVLWAMFFLGGIGLRRVTICNIVMVALLHTCNPQN